MNTIACPLLSEIPSDGRALHWNTSVVGGFKQLCDASAGKPKATVVFEVIPAQNATTLVRRQAAGTAGSAVVMATTAASIAPPVQSSGERHTSIGLAPLPTTKRPPPAGSNDPTRAVGDNTVVRAMAPNGCTLPGNELSRPTSADASRAPAPKSKSPLQAVTFWAAPATVVIRYSSSPPGSPFGAKMT